MPIFVFDVAEIYRNIKIEAEDEDEAREIAIMTIRDRWRDEVVVDLRLTYAPCIDESDTNTQVTYKVLEEMKQRVWDDHNRCVE